MVLSGGRRWGLVTETEGKKKRTSKEGTASLLQDVLGQ